MMIPLTKLQKEIMAEFYGCAPNKVIFNKAARNRLWKAATAKEPLDIDPIRAVCPALAHQIEKSHGSGNHIQSAVFSECVYAQTLANMLHLDKFTNCLEDHTFIPGRISALLKSYNLFPRYAYSNRDLSRILIQAGGCHGIDSALITVLDLNIYTIEFKEPGAKTCEPDLPKYKEDGKLLITADFLERYPQFEQMLREQKDLNFFDIMGRNENNFTPESVNIAVTNNYVKKYADVVCTEDINGYLVMMPANQISLWAEIVGEIRPAGKNHYFAWTPNALKNFIEEKGGKIENSIVTVKKSKLSVRRERGGDGKISGYKINSLFFIYTRHCTDLGDAIRFDLHNVQQLNPTIAGKMFFKTLKYGVVKNYYLHEMAST